MDVVDIILGIAIVIGIWLTTSKIEGYERTISELRNEVRKLKTKLEIEESSYEWATKAYDDLEEKYWDLIEKYNIQLPTRDEEEGEIEENSEDDEGEQMVDVVVKGKFGTRVEKVPATNINFKWMYPEDHKPWKYNENEKGEDK